jgi:hypothetical protein
LDCQVSLIAERVVGAGNQVSWQKPKSEINFSNQESLCSLALICHWPTLTSQNEINFSEFSFDRMGIDFKRSIKRKWQEEFVTDIGRIASTFSLL